MSHGADILWDLTRFLLWEPANFDSVAIHPASWRGSWGQALVMALGLVPGATRSVCTDSFTELGLGLRLRETTWGTVSRGGGRAGTQISVTLEPTRAIAQVLAFGLCHLLVGLGTSF